MLCRQTKLRSHIIYCDSDLNSDHTAYLNIYQNFLLAAMKMHQYIRNWGISIGKSSKLIQSNPFPYITLSFSLFSIRHCTPNSSLHVCNDPEQSLKQGGQSICRNMQCSESLRYLVRLCSLFNPLAEYLMTSDRLGFHAFHAVLSRKAPSYVAVLKHLTFELSRAHHNRSRKRFRSLVKEGSMVMAQIVFWSCVRCHRIIKWKYCNIPWNV